METRRIILAYVCVATFLLCACAAKEPSWIRGMPSDPIYYFGLGGPSESMDEAKQAARVELARTVEVRVESEIITIMSETNEKFDNLFIAKSRIYVKKKLQDANIVATYTNRDGHYALARIRRAVVQNLLLESVRADKEDVLDRIRKGKSAAEAGKLMDALREYSAAYQTGRRLPRKYDWWDERKSERLTFHIERALNRLVDEVELSIVSGDNQTGEYESALAEQLVLRAVFSRGHKKVPLAGLPLKAEYARGTGKLSASMGQEGEVVSLRTDEGGECKFSVSRIESISQKNQVRVTFDSTGAGDLHETLIPALTARLESKAVVFNYAADFLFAQSPGVPVITLNGSTVEQDFTEGTPVDIEVRVKRKSHLHLFQITADGKFSYQQSVAIFEAQQGAGWRIEGEQDCWVLKMDAVKVNASRGEGIETLLAVMTAKPVKWKPTQALTKEGLIRALSECSAGEWTVGCVSYQVLK